jgi:hypothetical protein
MAAKILNLDPTKCTPGARLLIAVSSRGFDTLNIITRVRRRTSVKGSYWDKLPALPRLVGLFGRSRILGGLSSRSARASCFEQVAGFVIVDSGGTRRTSVPSLYTKWTESIRYIMCDEEPNGLSKQCESSVQNKDCDIGVVRDAGAGCLCQFAIAGRIATSEPANVVARARKERNALAPRSAALPSTCMSPFGNGPASSPTPQSLRRDNGKERK